MYKYDAFISYRHNGLDGAVAEKLQKQLERYRPPKSFKGERTENWRVFRDETELSAGSDLDANIKDALKESRFLIVVCSPRTNESRWCKEEIEYFKTVNGGKNDRIITLVVEGEPEEIFPAALMSETVARTDDNGEVTYETHAVEPLAANISAPTKTATMRNLKKEFLRIAAPMLGCGYDDLYQRAQRRRVRNWIAVGTSIAALVFLFGLYSSAMLFKISTQAEELLRTNESLVAKTAEAEANLKEANRQRAVAEENLKEAEHQRKIAEVNLAEAKRQQSIAIRNAAEANFQRSIAQKNEAEAISANQNLRAKNAQILTDQAQLYLENGELYKAVRAAVDAIREGGKNTAAERIITSATGIYSNEKSRLNATVSLSGEVEFLRVTEDETRVFAYDSADVVSVVDAHSSELLCAYSVSELFSKTSLIVSAEVCGTVAYLLGSYGVCALDLTQGSLLWCYEPDDVSSYDLLVTSPESETLAMVNYYGPIVLNKRDGTVVFDGRGEKYSTENGGYSHVAAMDTDGTVYLANEDDAKLLVFRGGGIERYEYPALTEETDLLSLTVGKDAVYLNIVTSGDEDRGMLLSIAKSDMKQRWSYEYTDRYLSGFSYCNAFELKHNLPDENGEYHARDGVVLALPYSVHALDRRSGTNYFLAQSKDEIYEVRPNGMMLSLHTEVGLYTQAALFCGTINGVVTDLLYPMSGYEKEMPVAHTSGEILAYTSENHAKRFTVSRSITRSEHTMFEAFPEANWYYEPAADNGAGYYAATRSKSLGDSKYENSVFIFDTNEDRVVFETVIPIRPDELAFSKGHLFAVDDYDGAVVILSPDGKIRAQVMMKEEIAACLKDDRYVSVFDPYLHPIGSGVLYCVESGAYHITQDGAVRRVLSGEGLERYTVDGTTLAFVQDHYTTGAATVMTLDLKSGRLVKASVSAARDTISCVAQSGDTTVYLCTEGYFGVMDSDGNVRKISYAKNEIAPVSLVLSPDGKCLIVSCMNGALLKYDMETLALSATLETERSLNAYDTLTFVTEDTVLLQDGLSWVFVDADVMDIRLESDESRYFFRETRQILFASWLESVRRFWVCPYYSSDEILAVAEAWLGNQ